MKIIITGAAGFIGYHLALKLLENNNKVVGIDSLNSYYSVSLKQARLENLCQNKNFSFYEGDISNVKELKSLKIEDYDFVIHLAAQAGVRYSFENPSSYFNSNIKAHYNILENLRDSDVPLIYASSSSIYGNHKLEKTKENDDVLFPESFYGTTKKICESLSESYSKTFGLKSIGLRFFTVYGPFGRPDMAYWKFLEKGLNNEEIYLYENGEMYRDFTYIDDIVDGIYGTMHLDFSQINHEVYNLGNDKPEKVTKLIKIIESKINKQLKIIPKKKPQGDVFRTAANIDKARNDLKFAPQTSLEDGMAKFIEWYLDFKKHSV